MHRLLATTLATAAVALTALAGPAGAPALAEEAPGITLGTVGVAADSGGYPSINFGFYGLSATFTDATPDSSHRYVATASEVGGEEVVVEADAYVYEGWDGTFPTSVYLPNEEDMQIGDTFEVVVSEYAGDTLVERSAPVSHTVSVISHPDHLDLRTSREDSMMAGELVKLRWTGAFGDDVASVTQVVAARGRTFSDDARDFLVCQNSYCPTAKGVRYVRTRSKELTTRFRVPQRFAGSTLVISIYGQAPVVDGVSTAAPWGWFFELKVRR